MHYLKIVKKTFYIVQQTCGNIFVFLSDKDKSGKSGSCEICVKKITINCFDFIKHKLFSKIYVIVKHVKTKQFNYHVIPIKMWKIFPTFGKRNLKTKLS